MALREQCLLSAVRGGNRLDSGGPRTPRRARAPMKTATSALSATKRARLFAVSSEQQFTSSGGDRYRPAFGRRRRFEPGSLAGACLHPGPRSRCRVRLQRTVRQSGLASRSLGRAVQAGRFSWQLPVRAAANPLDHSVLLLHAARLVASGAARASMGCRGCSRCVIRRGVTRYGHCLNCRWYSVSPTVSRLLECTGDPTVLARDSDRSWRLYSLRARHEPATT